MAPPSGLEGDLGAVAPPPSLVKDTTAVDFSPFGVLPASQAMKTTAGDTSRASFEAALDPPDVATFVAAAPLWVPSSGSILGLGTGAS